MRHKWLFDEYYTTMAIEGLDKNKDGVYDREELAELAKVNIEGLKDFAYFTFPGLGGKEIALGASRDKPSLDSLGALLKSEGQSPQQLSYLIPILAQAGICRVRRQGRAFIVVRVEK